MPTDIIRIQPQAGPQTAFLSSKAQIIIYGGQAGGGKTYGLLMYPLRYRNIKGYSAVYFRRKFTDIDKPGGSWDTANELYPLFNGRSKGQPRQYEFPGGGKVVFSHLCNEKDKHNWQTAQVPTIMFDELTQFEESQFFYLLSRNRSMVAGVPRKMMAGTNPMPGWLADIISWWIDEEGYALDERSGIIRWFCRPSGDAIEWGDSKEELHRKFGYDQAVYSLTFIKSTLEDNPKLLERNPEYRTQLRSLALVDRERLEKGNWKIRPSAGKVFNRSWYPIVEKLPAGGDDVLAFDFAATEKTLSGDDPDYTAIVHYRKNAGKYYVQHAQMDRLNVADSERAWVNMSRQAAEKAQHEGATFTACFGEGKADAGKRDAHRMRKTLLDIGIDAVSINEKDDIVTRARKLSSETETGNIHLLNGGWNEMYLNQMHGFPDLDHDDIPAASIIGYMQYTKPKWGFAK